MSIFRSLRVSCPKCRSVSPRDTVYSVNADRRPDLRVEITNDSFQLTTCPSCGAVFRLDPEFVFVDVSARQWVAAYPLSKLAQWQTLESEAQTLFDRVYGDEASEFLQNQGKTLVRRITFGWAALREKLIVAETNLNDTAIELCKVAILRSAHEAPIDGRVDLRLLDADEEALSFGWMLARNEELTQAITVAREMYDEIATDPEDGWAELRAQLTSGLYVDLNRLLLEPRSH